VDRRVERQRRINEGLEKLESNRSSLSISFDRPRKEKTTGPQSNALKTIWA